MKNIIIYDFFLLGGCFNRDAVQQVASWRIRHQMVVKTSSPMCQQIRTNCVVKDERLKM